MPNDSGPPRIRACVLLPTFNNCRTIGRVIEGCLCHVPDVIVINDGCTDGTADILASIPGLDLVSFASNRGKGAALRAGFERAAERGFTHAISLDTDGQHLPEDLPAFLGQIARRPEALGIGVRRLPQAGFRPRKTALLRGNSNFWLWVTTGTWLDDSQTGFRSYPIAAIAGLNFKAVRYDFETEVLTKILWMGVPIESVPVSATYGPGSESHFRAFSDSFWWIHLTAMLLWQRILLPRPVRRLMHQKSFRALPRGERFKAYAIGAVLQESTTPATFALAVAVGVFFGVFPIWGFQMAAAAAVAHRLRLSKPVVLAASNISFGVMLPIIVWLSILAGQVLLRGETHLDLDFRQLDVARLGEVTLEYLVGAGVLAVAAACLFGSVAWMSGRAVQRLGARRAT